MAKSPGRRGVKRSNKRRLRSTDPNRRDETAGRVHRPVNTAITPFVAVPSLGTVLIYSPPPQAEPLPLLTAILACTAATWYESHHRRHSA